MSSLDRGVYVLELGRKICSINPLTSQQRASLTDQQHFRIFRFVANHPNLLKGCLDHLRGRSQPTEEESSSSDLPTARLLGADQEALLEVQNAPEGTS